MPRAPLLYRCGDQLWVPLFGLWGAVSYALLMVLRQFLAKQFIPATTWLNRYEFMYGASREPKEVDQLIFVWKHPHRMRLGNILDKVTPEYVVWRAQKIEDKVMLPARMRIPVTDPPPKKPSELEIAQAEFEVERLKMEQESKRLREKSEKWEDQAQK